MATRSAALPNSKLDQDAVFEWLLVIYVFALGAAIGSFSNVVAHRYARSASPTGRSKCPNCSHQLRWFELVPIASFTLQAGRCRHCRGQISPRYPTVELVFGLMAVAMLTPFPVDQTLLITQTLLFGVVSLLGILFLIDLETFLLPDKYVVLLAIFTILYLTATQTTSLNFSLTGAAIGAGFLGLLWLITKGQGIGLGDAKLMVPVGILLGPSGVIIHLFISFTAGATIAILLLATKRATPKTAIPFGPYLCGTAILMLLFPQITSFFQQFIIPI